MTTPRVTELRRRLEATSPDTFINRPAAQDGPLAAVIVLHPGDGRRRRQHDRRGAPGLRVVGPEDSAA